MVKLAIGERVVIDLWDPDKKRGIAKHYGDTMDLVNAESEFELKVGDPTFIIKSHEGYVLLIPADNDFTKMITDKGLTIDVSGLTRKILEFLKKSEATTGGILSEEELLEKFMQTPLKYLITIDYLRKTLKLKNAPFEQIKQGKLTYYALHPQDVTLDKQVLLQYSKNHAFLTIDMLQADYGWSDLRIQRILNYLVDSGRCRKDTSFIGGIRYFFNQLN